MSSLNPAVFRRRLLRWYETHKRDLPWRRTGDPYAIWVSESMLQQTQVGTVIPYYRRFMRAFPTFEALDRAPLARVLALWSGLGYYRRAENLKRTARIVMQRHCGRLPESYEELRTLPGIGEYTAGALLSIAFGRPYPAVDGNARRVLGRVFFPADETKIREIARSFVSKTKPGQFNQSLMELGSVVCTPANPACVACPIAPLCAAHKRRPRLPRPLSQKRSEPRPVLWPLAIVRRSGKVLLRRRAAQGVLAGLWELPGGEETYPPVTDSLLGEHLPEKQHPTAHALHLGELAHSITNRRIRAPVFLIEWQGGTEVRLDAACWRWVAPESLRRQPTSAMTRKAMKLLAIYEKSSR
jgi:A/G-specific adenine glycosylase